MKKLSRLFSAAFILFAAVSCGTKEIDHPDIPDTPQDSEITITASIIQTRVSYDCSDPGEVKQEWEVGDILFGYYHQKDTDPSTSTSNRIVFQVVKVDSGTGIATLKVSSPKDWIDNATDKTVVDLVYTGDVDVDVDNLPFSGSGIDVDLSGQRLDRVPGCMHAHAELQVKDNKKSLEFYFQNDCALIEIDSLTGFVEDWPGGSEISIDLSSVHITNLLLGGSYSFSNGELVFDSDEDSFEDDYAIELEPGWAVGNDGAISGPHGEKILIAVAPNPVENEINVSAEKTSEMGTIQYPSYTYGERSLAGGLCYVISAQPVVARTADGECFKSVSAAFDHAEALSGQGYNTASKNVVTLIKKEIDGFGDVSEIEIDYPVTLDLNGCTLYLAEKEEFYVAVFTGEITIQDGTDEDNQVKYDGTISSTSLNPILWNCGTVNIHGGNLIYDEDNNLINNFGTVNISDGFLKSYAESDEGNDEYYSVVYNEATLNIDGGTLYSVNCDTIRNNESGTVTISGGTITSEDNRAITNYGDLTISEGNLSSSAEYVSSEDEGYVDEDSKDYEDQNCRGTIYNWSNLTITGGTIESEHCRALYNSGTTTITGGTIEALEDMAIMNFEELTVGKIPAESNDAIKIITDSNYTDIPAIYCDGGDFDMYYGTVTCPAGAMILENGNKGTITGGKFVSSNDDTIKILNGSDCTISGGVISSSCSAILLDGAIGKISGGVISNNSNALETILILNGAECTISGGVIYSKGEMATVACRSDKNFTKSKLTVKWPTSKINGMTNEQYGVSIKQPLIYSFGSAYQSSPITANDDNMDNTAEVYIQGGYLLAHNQNSHGFFYNDDRSPQGQPEGFDNLKLSQCGQFYANTYRVNTQGNTYNPDCDINLREYSDVNGNKFDVTTYSNLHYTPDFFEDYFDEDDFDEGFPEETVLYYFEFK